MPGSPGSFIRKHSMNIIWKLIIIFVASLKIAVVESWIVLKFYFKVWSNKVPLTFNALKPILEMIFWGGSWF
jgi:hypothetical protein